MQVVLQFLELCWTSDEFSKLLWCFSHKHALDCASSDLLKAFYGKVQLKALFKGFSAPVAVLWFNVSTGVKLEMNLGARGNWVHLPYKRKMQ